MSVLKQIDDHIESLNKSLNQAYYVRTFVLEHLATFDSLPESNLCGDYIDFDNLPHEQVMEVIRSFPGRWKKVPREGKIDYSITLRNASRTTGLYEIKIRCYSGEPPPNCKVVYEDVHVPASTVRRAKLVCVERPDLNGNGEVKQIEEKEAEDAIEVF